MDILRENYEFGGIIYLVCSTGDIFGPTGKKLKARKNADGYAVVTMVNKRIKRSTKFVHRLVAELFLPNPENLSDVDHLDNDRMNPDVSNLELHIFFHLKKYMSKKNSTIVCGVSGRKNKPVMIGEVTKHPPYFLPSIGSDQQ